MSDQRPGLRRTKRELAVLILKWTLALLVLYLFPIGLLWLATR